MEKCKCDYGDPESCNRECGYPKPIEIEEALLDSAEIVKVRYTLGNTDSENAVYLGDKKIDTYIRRILLDIQAGEVPEITIKLAPLGCEFDIKGNVIFTVDDIPSDKEFELYKILKGKYA